MDRLTRSSLALALAAAPVAADAAGPSDRWHAEIALAAQRFRLPEPWIRRVMAAESGGHTMLAGRPIRSRAGAMGLMQLMPATWIAMRDRHGLGPDPDDPRDNILAGAAYLRAMYDRFGYPGLFGAYNAGPGRYAAYRDRAVALPAETRLYLDKVTAGAYSGAMPIAGSAPTSLPSPRAPSLFAVGGAASPAALDPVVADADRPSIFAIRKVIP